SRGGRASATRYSFLGNYKKTAWVTGYRTLGTLFSLLWARFHPVSTLFVQKITNVVELSPPLRYHSDTKVVTKETCLMMPRFVVLRLASAAAVLCVGLGVAIASPLTTAAAASGSQFSRQISMAQGSYTVHAPGESNTPSASPIIVPPPPPPGGKSSLMAKSPIIVPPPPPPGGKSSLM